MDHIKNEYFDFILYNALEKKCENTIVELFKEYNLLQIYEQIKIIISIIINAKTKITDIEYKMNCLKEIFINKNKNYMQKIFYYACKYGYYETVVYLVNKDIDININSETEYAIFIAEYNNYYNIVEYLIKNGANIHINQDKLLEHAVEINNMERAKYWLSKGLNIHIRNENNLFISIANNNMEMIRFIVNNGADIRIENDSPLRFAIQYKHYNIAEYLVRHGANIDIL